MEAGDAPVEEEALMGAKKILIHATTRYPIVSAYEFEFLMKEDVIRKRMKGCTLYLILQRPLTYMTNLRESHDGIHFDIVDDHQAPLRCHLPLIENKIAAADELMTLDVLFLKRTPDTKSPFNDVAGFKLWRENGSFVVWYSPHKFLYEVLVGSLHANIEGDPCRFLDFRVHYIGQTISQRVWKRLTGHHKLQKVLTMEGPVNEKRGNRVAWEVSLVMLSIDDFESLSDFLCAEGHEMIPKGKHHDYIDEHSKKAQETESPQTFFRRTDRPAAGPGPEQGCRVHPRRIRPGWSAQKATG